MQPKSIFKIIVGIWDHGREYAMERNDERIN